MAFGYFLGIYESCTDPLSFLILQKSGKVLIRKSVHGLTEDELKDPRVMDGLKELNDAIQHKLGDKKKDTEIDPDVQAALQAEPEIAEDDPFVDEADKNNPNLIPTVENSVDPVTHTHQTLMMSILRPLSCSHKGVNRRWPKYCGGDTILSLGYRSAHGTRIRSLTLDNMRWNSLMVRLILFQRTSLPKTYMLK
jgi:hypothetical protein